MKKSRFYLSMAIVALSWMGCSQEEEVVNQMQMGGGKTINATIESTTRSTVTDAGVFSWTTGDAISLHDGTDVDTYKYSGSGNGFTLPDETTETVTEPIVAYYPASGSHTKTAFNLPAFYYDADTEYVASTNAAMIATPPTEGSTYAFMHLGGVMRFNVKNVPADADGFQFTAEGMKITGSFDIENGDAKTIKTSESTDNDTNVSIWFKQPGEICDMTFYVPMPTGTYGDYTVSLRINGTLISHTSKDVTNTINRKTLLLMPTFTYDAGEEELIKGSVASDNAIDLNDGSAEAEIIGNAEVAVTPGDADATATLNYTPATDGSSALAISDGTESVESTQSEGQVVVATSKDATIASCEINTPSLTVELTAAENTIATYEEVTALTAQQTLIIGEGVTINKLIVKGGNVVLKGNVKSIESEVATTIKLENDIVSDEIITISGPITIDGNGKTLISTAGRAINVETDGSVTIKNLNVVANGERAFNVINQPAKLTLEGVTATAKNYAVMIATSAGANATSAENAATLTINNSDLAGLNVVNIAGAYTQATINNTNLTCNDQKANENYGAISVNSTGKNVSVTVNGGKITVKDDSYVGQSIADGVSITLANDVVIEKDESNTNYISYGACYIPYSNQTSYGFTSLAEALEWAKGGETIVLAKNITITANTEIPANITIDGKDYGVSTDTEAGVAGKGKGVFLLTGGTIKNVNFTSPNTQYDIIVKAGGSVIEGCKFNTASEVTNAEGTTTYGKRAIYTGSSVELTGNLTVTGCTFDDQVYAFNFLSGKNKMDVTFKDCTLGGWLSGTGASHTFTNCTFMESGDYANYIPYCPATFNGCTFENGFTISVKHGSTYTFDTNCKYNKENETEIELTNPNSLKWDFSGSGTDNGSNETVTIGGESNKWTIEVGDNDEITWKSSSNEGGSGA